MEKYCFKQEEELLKSITDVLEKVYSLRFDVSAKKDFLGLNFDEIDTNGKLPTKLPCASYTLYIAKKLYEFLREKEGLSINILLVRREKGHLHFCNAVRVGGISFYIYQKAGAFNISPDLPENYEILWIEQYTNENSIAEVLQKSEPLDRFKIRVSQAVRKVLLAINTLSKERDVARQVRSNEFWEKGEIKFLDHEV